MKLKDGGMTSDEWVELTSAMPKALEGTKYPYTQQELDKIICNRYNVDTPDDIDEKDIYDFIMFLNCLADSSYRIIKLL